MKLYKPNVTVDTSAIARWFKLEENKELALELRNRVDKPLQVDTGRLKIFKYMIVVLS